MTGPMGTIVPFPARRATCVWILRQGAAWLVLARDHGWLHGNYDAALADAYWLGRNLGLVVRRVQS
jgi:hypothetical protein